MILIVFLQSTVITFLEGILFTFFYKSGFEDSTILIFRGFTATILLFCSEIFLAGFLSILQVSLLMMFQTDLEMFEESAVVLHIKFASTNFIVV
jgi:hypothetical protein